MYFFRGIRIMLLWKTVGNFAGIITNAQTNQTSRGKLFWKSPHRTPLHVSTHTKNVNQSYTLKKWTRCDLIKFWNRLWIAKQIQSQSLIIRNNFWTVHRNFCRFKLVTGSSQISGLLLTNSQHGSRFRLKLKSNYVTWLTWINTISTCFKTECHA